MSAVSIQNVGLLAALGLFVDCEARCTRKTHLDGSRAVATSASPVQGGFGMRLLEQRVAGGLGGNTQLEYLAIKPAR